MRKAFPVITYLTYIAIGAWLAISSKIDLNKLSDRVNSGEAENFEGLAGIGLAIAMIIGIAYAALALIGLIFKSLHNAKGWLFFGFLSAVVSLAFTIVNGAFAISAINDGAQTVYTVASVSLLALSVVSLVTDCASLSGN